MTTRIEASEEALFGEPQLSDGAMPFRDGKRYAWLFGLIVPIMPLLASGLVAMTGRGIFWFTGPLLVFVLIPVLDLLIGTDGTNPPDSAVAGLEADRYYRYCTFAYIPLQYVSLLEACRCWSSGELSILDSVGLALTVGCVSGIAINTAHELGHKREELERWLSKVALAQSGYGHFYVEHNRGHHVRVSTPEDPASARYGESLYAFLPRTISGSLKSSLELERARLARAGHSFWSLHNDVFNAWAMTLALFGALLLGFGVAVLPYLLLQAAIGILLLEIVNYLEHYGLLRQQREDGRYERCQPQHSWNSNNVTSNVFLYHLQRHSDHHAHPMRRYQALRHFDEAPNLPSGYATMILLAIVPPLWRKIMDPRVRRHYRGDLTQANLQPRERRRLSASGALSS